MQQFKLLKENFRKQTVHSDLNTLFALLNKKSPFSTYIQRQERWCFHGGTVRPLTTHSLQLHQHLQHLLLIHERLFICMNSKMILQTILFPPHLELFP